MMHRATIPSYRHRRRIRFGATKLLLAWAVALLVSGGSLFAQNKTAAPATASIASSAPNSQAQVLDHLNHVLRWSRAWDGIGIYASRSGDDLYVENGRAIARQVVGLEFQSALAQAQLIGQASASQPVANLSNTINAQSILVAQQNAQQQMTNLRLQLDAVNRQLLSANSQRRKNLLSQRDTLQGQFDLAQALQENLQKLTAFMTTADNASGAATELTAKIQALQRSIPGAEIASPELSGTKSAVTAAPIPPAPTATSNPDGQGLIGELSQMIRMVQGIRALHNLSDDATELQASTKAMRAPLLAALRETLQQGQVELSSVQQEPASATPAAHGTPKAAAPAAAPPAAASPVATPNATAAPNSAPRETPLEKQRQMVALVQRFKLLSKATLPLSQEMILIDQSQANLSQMRASLQHDYMRLLRTLLLKVATILLALGLIWLFSELWRRATFRYVRDARRRRQFLVLRRVVTGFCMFVVILLGFVSDFSSLATYAGLITAGVAVALQAVILSIAAYFFLVGRYGVRVGDRITVVYNGANSVTGDVVDIGLVRFYMMELAGGGTDMQPTGRICAFPNSVLFQTNPLFKQLPGTEYIWREIALPLAPDADSQLTETALMKIVQDLYSKYSPQLERQHLNIEANMGVHMEVPRPYSRVRFSGAGLEVVVRYPVLLRQAAEMDDEIVQQVTNMLRRNPQLALRPGAVPELRSSVKA